MKLLKIILIILIAGSILYFVFNFSKNNNLKDGSEPLVSNLYVLPSISSKDTIGWKQYKSNNFNFSFYYPPNYSVKEETRIFNDLKYPFVAITSNQSGLQLIYDFKIEFGLTELGFSTEKYPFLKQKPQIIRFKENSEWIYYKKSSDGTCVSPDGSTSIKDGENNIFCYDVNFPYNWYYSFFIPNEISPDSEEVKNTLNNFDKIILTLNN